MCLIAHDIGHHSPKSFNHAQLRNIKKLPNPHIIVKDIKLRFNDDGCKIFKDTDIFKKGVIHGRCTLNNILHISVFLGYKKIIFVGVDLYDSRYFWLKNNETRYTVREKRRNFKSRHAIHRATISLLLNFKKTNDIETFVYNPKSLLSSVMPVWKR